MDYEGKYKVILVDCPWAYSNFRKAKHGAPQYSTLSYEQLREIPIKKWAGTDCLLFSWCTWPMMAQGVQLIHDWEFDYVTGWAWIKTVPSTGRIRVGTGFWAQSPSEFIQIARRGWVSPPKRRYLGLMKGKDRQFYAPIKGHSAKPDDIHTYIENNFEGPYLELFARKSRAGWDCWGLDTGVILGADGAKKLSSTSNINSASVQMSSDDRSSAEESGSSSQSS